MRHARLGSKHKVSAEISDGNKPLGAARFTRQNTRSSRGEGVDLITLVPKRERSNNSKK